MTLFSALPVETEDPKRTRILEGAAKVFLAYGFTRTTMDDIARAADVSRPALYLIFRNKSDIYRALASAFLHRSLEIARNKFDADGAFADRLDAMLDCAFVHLMAEVEASPHGPELFDMKNSLAADIVAEWRGSMLDLIERAIVDEVRHTGIDLPARGFDARTLGAFLLDALEGMKTQISGRPETKREAVRSLVRVIAAALRP